MGRHAARIDRASCLSAEAVTAVRPRSLIFARFGLYCMTFHRRNVAKRKETWPIGLIRESQVRQQVLRRAHLLQDCDAVGTLKTRSNQSKPRSARWRAFVSLTRLHLALYSCTVAAFATPAASMCPVAQNGRFCRMTAKRSLVL
jgi:hypothetical protein